MKTKRRIKGKAGVVWVRYLRISASYFLAKKFSEGSLNKTDESNLPHDFDRVLATYRDFGDVWSAAPAEWSQRKRKELFEIKRRSVNLTNVMSLAPPQTTDLEYQARWIKKFLSEANESGDYYPGRLYAVSFKGDPVEIMQEINIRISRDLAFHRNKYSDHIEAPKYSLEINKVRGQVLKQCFFLVREKALNPEWKTWQLAAALDISKTNTEKILAAERYKEANVQYDSGRIPQAFRATTERQIVNAIIGRYLRNAFVLAENAARGRFPLQEDILDAAGKSRKTYFDFENIRKLALENKI
jgi:hypothetical protein